MRFVQYDTNSPHNILGFYDDSFHESIPSNTIEISDIEYILCRESSLVTVDPVNKCLVIEERVASKEDLTRKLISHTEYLLNKEAKDLGYSSILSAVSYADESSVPKFQIEGKSIRAWRSLVWEKCDEMIEESVEGKLEWGDLDWVKSQLPTLSVAAIE